MDEDELTAEQEPDERKTRSWNRLKAKLPFRRRRSSVENDDQPHYGEDGRISDFLYSTPQDSQGAPLAPPRIDVSAAKDSDGQAANFEKFVFSKPPRAIGLRVGFSNQPPELIGVGGDEAEEPSLVISQRKLQARPIRAGFQRPHAGSAPPMMEPRIVSAEREQQHLPAPPAPDMLLAEPTRSGRAASLSPSRPPDPSDISVPAQYNPRRRPAPLDAGELKQRMRADEGRVFLSASPKNPNAVRRKPVGESGSESSSRDPSPPRQYVSPPASRGSDQGGSQPPQYPPALLPSHVKRPKSYHEQSFSEFNSLRPPSSGSESSLRNSNRPRHSSNLSNGSINAQPGQQSASGTPRTSPRSERPDPLLRRSTQDIESSLLPQGPAPGHFPSLKHPRPQRRISPADSPGWQTPPSPQLLSTESSPGLEKPTSRKRHSSPNFAGWQTPPSPPQQSSGRFEEPENPPLPKRPSPSQPLVTGDALPAARPSPSQPPARVDPSLAQRPSASQLPARVEPPPAQRPLPSQTLASIYPQSGQRSSSSQRPESSGNQSSRDSGNFDKEDCLCKEILADFRITINNPAVASAPSDTLPMPWRMTHVYRSKPGNEDDAQAYIRSIVFDPQSSLTGTFPRNRSFKLYAQHPLVVTLLADPSPGLSISIHPRARDPGLVSHLQTAQSLLRTVPTSHHYQFPTLKASHTFQTAVTNHAVRFDAVAALFSISRRRSMVPIHKSYDAANARVQVVQQGSSNSSDGSTTQVVAFFSDYELAEALCFEVHGFDVFETSENPKEEVFTIKLVDAKFALPDLKKKSGDDDGSGKSKDGFVCLDGREYAAEHEDITIGFRDERARDDFANALPAPVSGPKRFTLRRRI